jgi:hypothetical protein
MAALRGDISFRYLKQFFLVFVSPAAKFAEGKDIGIAFPAVTMLTMSGFCDYRILRTIGRYIFFPTRWLRPIVHIDLYKDEVKKISIKMTILFTVVSIPLFCCRFFFLNKIEIIDVLGVVYVLNKAIKVYY